MRILISACLLGARCRYDGVSKLQPWISDLAERHILVPVCPEQLGGLPTPRPPAERRGDQVMTRDGGDVTAQYRRGAEEALRLCRLLGCEAALLKERSPSCGSGMVYDGTFTGVGSAFRCTESPGWRSWRTPSKQARQPRTAQRPENGAAPFFSSPARFTTRGKRGRLEAMNMGEERET